MNEASIPPNHLTEALVHNQVSGNTDRTCCTSCKPALPLRGGCTPAGPPPPPPPPMSSISQNGQPPTKIISLLYKAQQNWSVWEASAVQSSPSCFSVVLWEQTGLTSQLECQDTPPPQNKTKKQKKNDNNNNPHPPTPTHITTLKGGPRCSESYVMAMHQRGEANQARKACCTRSISSSCMEPSFNCPSHLTEALDHSQVSGKMVRTCCTSCKLPAGPPPSAVP